MANIIELQQEQNTQSLQTPRIFRQSLKTIFRRQYNNQCKKIDDLGKQISFFIKPSQCTYRLTTLWHFSLDKPVLILKVSFYTKQEDNFLRAETNRIKIEAYILMRMINATVRGYQFRIQPQSGTIYAEYCINWDSFYRVFSKQENIVNFIKTLFHFFRKYDAMLRFLELYKIQQPKQKDESKIRINKFRYIMKTRKKFRNSLQGSIGDLFKLTELKQNIPQQNVEKLHNLFYQSIHVFLQANFDEDYSIYNQSNLNKQILTIQKNQTGTSTIASSFKSQIVMGISKIKEDGKSTDQILSEEGGHATIFRKKFRYSIIDTINNGTMNFQPYQGNNRTKQTRGDLAYKICRSNKESSVNSFKNQISILKHLKQEYSPYIAKYYLLVKQAWDEKDIIYMNIYKDNMYSMLAKHKLISLKNKLILTYGICKGMCFLWSKGILHRDFKPQNILIDSAMCPKIIDFGSCSAQHQTNRIVVHDERLLYTQGFHIPYQALGPELMNKFTRQAYEKHPLFDIYGFGRTLCYIFFDSINPPSIQSLKCQPNSQILEHILFLVYNCLQVDSDQRPTFGQITSYIGILPDLLKSQEQIRNQCQLFQQ